MALLLTVSSRTCVLCTAPHSADYACVLNVLDESQQRLGLLDVAVHMTCLLAAGCGTVWSWDQLPSDLRGQVCEWHPVETRAAYVRDLVIFERYFPLLARERDDLAAGLDSGREEPLRGLVIVRQGVQRPVDTLLRLRAGASQTAAVV
ncbi:MAG: hypothetical protein KKA73_17985 [Chloroflexi bacterium]|nr:hypothetical protein [Chloroflexota bacterium]